MLLILGNLHRVIAKNICATPSADAVVMGELGDVLCGGGGIVVHVAQEVIQGVSCVVDDCNNSAVGSQHSIQDFACLGVGDIVHPCGATAQRTRGFVGATYFVVAESLKESNDLLIDCELFRLFHDSYLQILWLRGCGLFNDTAKRLTTSV